MDSLVFLKLGGSLITDKQQEMTAREEIIRRAAQEVREALRQGEGLRLLLGHGSGSFGHFVAQRYGTQKGASDERGWEGLTRTGAAAAKLNRLVTDIFLDEGLPVVSLQPSASARCRAGQLLHLETWPIEEALSHGLVPLVYGDVSFDEEQGCCIISTEQIFIHLARHLKPRRIILAGEVAGVFTGDPHQNSGSSLVERITPRNFHQLRGMMAGAQGFDVTGGMFAKVEAMYALVVEQPWLEVYFVSGHQPGLIRQALLGEGPLKGTLLCSDQAL